MKTTEVLVEHFVAGILMTAAVFFLFWSLRPQEIEPVLFQVSLKLKEFTAVTGALLSAVVYAIGLVAEAGCRFFFDWRFMDQVKKERLDSFISANRDSLVRSPILAPVSSEPYGLMRLYVMKSNSDLYREIESQMNRLRLVRVLFLVEALVVVGLLPWLWRHGSSASLWACLGFVVFLMWGNWVMIKRRCGLYCRAIERAYQVLVLL